jgi:integrase
MNTEDFLLEFRSPSTRKTYRIALEQFFAFKNTTQEEYLATKQNYCHDLKIFVNDLLARKTPKTTRTYVGGVISFLQSNEIEMPRNIWEKLSIVNRAVTKDDVPTKEELRSILTHSDVCGRAMILLGASSGLRIGDILNLKLKDVKSVLGNHPPKLTIVQQKTGQEQIVFFSQECAQAIGEWLKVRDDYLSWSYKHCSERGIGEVDPDSDFLFPFQYSKAQCLWNSALEASGLTKKDENTTRRTLHIHSLRKYFRTTLGLAGTKPDVSEALLGHVNGLREYNRYTPEDIKKEYLKAEEKLTVAIEIVENQETQHTIRVLQERIRLLEDAIGKEILKDITLHPESKKVWENTHVFGK